MNDKLYFLLITFFINISYCLLEGHREALYYHIKMKSGLLDKVNEHGLFSLQRAFFYLIILTSNFIMFNHDMELSVVLVLTYFLQFSLFHDGAYYVERNKLDPSVYPDKFFDQSTTSTAWTDKFMTPAIRIIMAALGIVVFFFIIQVVK